MWHSGTEGSIPFHPSHPCRQRECLLFVYCSFIAKESQVQAQVLVLVVTTEAWSKMILFARARVSEAGIKMSMVCCQIRLPEAPGNRNHGCRPKKAVWQQKGPQINSHDRLHALTLGHLVCVKKKQKKQKTFDEVIKANLAVLFSCGKHL